MVTYSLDHMARALKPECFSEWKVVTITEFPTGAEVIIEEAHQACSDGSLYVENEKSERGEGDREKNRERAARRAKSQVRKRCKMIQATQMLTCTYRENMQDFDRLERDHKALVNKLRQYVPDFEYVTCIERQERGALHLHMAIPALPLFIQGREGVKVKSAVLVRRLWRSIVGADNGSVHLTAPRRNAAHRIASYISKYISKSLEDAVFNKKSYWSSRGIPKPKVVKLWFSKDENIFDIFSLVVSEYFGKGWTDVSQYRNWFNSVYWLSFTKPR